MGMQIIHEKIVSIGGKLDINTLLGKGTKFVITIPVKKNS
jgi:chemotaxis protein histidine kinase CheA